MTDEMMTLRGLIEKSADANLLREMIGFVAERLIELEVGGLTGVAHGETSADRMVPRYGYRKQELADAGRHGGVVHPKSAQGLVVPRFPGAATHGRVLRQAQDEGR